MVILNSFLYPRKKPIFASQSLLHNGIDTITNCIAVYDRPDIVLKTNRKNLAINIGEIDEYFTALCGGRSKTVLTNDHKRVYGTYK